MKYFTFVSAQIQAKVVSPRLSAPVTASVWFPKLAVTLYIKPSIEMVEIASSSCVMVTTPTSPSEVP